MPKITRTRYGGVWPSSSAESDGTIYALDGVDADVSDASIRPMRAPRLVSPETGRSLFVEDCVLLLNSMRVFTAHNSVGGHTLFRTGAKGYPEVAYSLTPISTAGPAILLPAAPQMLVTLTRSTADNQPISSEIVFEGLIVNSGVLQSGRIVTFSSTPGLSGPYRGTTMLTTGGAVVTGTYPTYTVTTFPSGATVAFTGNFSAAAAGLNTLTMDIAIGAGVYSASASVVST